MLDNSLFSYPAAQGLFLALDSLVMHGNTEGTTGGAKDLTEPGLMQGKCFIPVFGLTFICNKEK